ncbi:hypothetical protein [Nocardia huaxiensis]|uniref:hypothetical protein n=1 Tax=Nocardia huaxiensis TaxID=2755382 RepID=UPI001E4BF376|nr:hypothetical protein [Nocardia huaxiensis]UFS96998.1 hypothetical protein LPY97_03425 [Nocardia huaxiensis]
MAASMLVANCGGSSEADPVRALEECGGIRLPSSATVVENATEDLFPGDKIVEVVVDLPAADLAPFKSALESSAPKQTSPDVLTVPDRFEAEPAPYWRESYWQDSGLTDELRAASGNEYFRASNGNVSQWVVAHDLGGGKYRIFARGAC